MPLTEKGARILAEMKEQYGEEEGERVFYASKNAGKITGVDHYTETKRGATMARKTRDAGGWSESDHPRGKGGEFSSGGGGGGAGPAGHEELHKKLTASGHKHTETETHHVWSKSDIKGGTETRVSKASGPTNKAPEAAKPWYHKVEREHGKSKEGPGGTRITGSGFQQRTWHPPKKSTTDTVRIDVFSKGRVKVTRA